MCVKVNCCLPRTETKILISGIEKDEIITKNYVNKLSKNKRKFHTDINVSFQQGMECTKQGCHDQGKVRENLIRFY